MSGGSWLRRGVALGALVLAAGLLLVAGLFLARPSAIVRFSAYCNDPTSAAAHAAPGIVYTEHECDVWRTR